MANLSKLGVGVALLSGIVVMMYPEVVFASAVQTFGQIASNLVGSFKGIAKLITAGSYLAGGAFAVGAIMKFKQHRDNPTQITVGTPIALLFIAAALMFLPTVYKSAGYTVFGKSTVPGGISGENNFN